MKKTKYTINLKPHQEKCYYTFPQPCTLYTVHTPRLQRKFFIYAVLQKFQLLQIPSAKAKKIALFNFHKYANFNRICSVLECFGLERLS